MARRNDYESAREESLRRAQRHASALSVVQEAEEQETAANYIYMNPAQRAVYNYRCRNTTVEAGRGTGKTDGLITPEMAGCIQSMPRGTGLFLGNSIKQLFTKTVPKTLYSLERMTGLKEGVHFFRGHAPAKCNFKEPIVKPKVWENCIHFWNGFVYYMISTGVKAAANGMDSCSIIGDECRFMPEGLIKAEILPTLRGINTNHPGFDENLNPYYKSIFFVSDAPLTKRQAWLRKRRDEQTPEINRKIAEMIREAQICPEIVQAPKYQRELNKLRCQASIYFSFSSIENIDILGEQFIRTMQKELTPTMFDISIRNVEKEEINDGYYANFDPDVHCYLSNDEEQLEAAQKYKKRTITQIYNGGRTLRVESESIDLNELSKAQDCCLDTDIKPGEPLRIAFDYNAHINCLVIGQTDSRSNTGVLRILNSMTNVKNTRIEGLCKMFCKYYEPHRLTCRDVIFYYDDTAKQGAAYASERHEETRFYNIVKKVLRSYGWNVIEIPMGRPMSHNKKYEFLNGCFAGTQRPFLRINKENNEYLIASMENARVKEGRNGFEKDKSQEKARVSKEVDDIEAELSTRTDLSDAFDTLVIGVRYYGSGRMIGVGMPMSA
ncbi:MAG TPA: hypothetical protein K8W02_01520 [Mediterranea massiliensis]|uniref:Uncharacterized protein n=1 Tax=Mediterranea massiliensis TaxID=1841865 RepID=A0A921HW99_9BACT|nr:hypothetical protein [Mediterranea massiliensis]HJF91056.1 hypothetical protein [Mediterranea massiliensis]